MPPFLIAFLFGAGFGTWVFTKVQRSSGGNTQSSGVTAAIAGIFAFVVMLLVLGFVDNMLQN